MRLHWSYASYVFEIISEIGIYDTIWKFLKCSIYVVFAKMQHVVSYPSSVFFEWIWILAPDRRCELGIRAVLRCGKKETRCACAVYSAWCAVARAAWVGDYREGGVGDGKASRATALRHACVSRDIRRSTHRSCPWCPRHPLDKPDNAIKSVRANSKQNANCIDSLPIFLLEFGATWPAISFLPTSPCSEKLITLWLNI